MLDDFALTKVLLNKACCSHFTLTFFIIIKIVLEKTFFQRSFEFF